MTDSRSRESRYRWPDGAPAAVSLTYDDGNENNLDYAIPDLEEYGFRGTFYLQVGRSEVQDRASDWQRAFDAGHEIGNHTVHHPCRADAYGNEPPRWLPPEKQLEHYTPERIRKEVTEAAEWLDLHIGVDPMRTFAHPCCATGIGFEPDEASYDAAIGRHHFAARVGGQHTNDPASVNLMRIKSFGVNQPTGEQLIGYCREALDTGDWSVIMFHGIGGPSHTTEREVHRELLKHLSEHEYFVAPLRDVADRVRRHRQRMGA